MNFAIGSQKYVLLMKYWACIFASDFALMLLLLSLLQRPNLQDLDLILVTACGDLRALSTARIPECWVLCTAG